MSEVKISIGDRLRAEIQELGSATIMRSEKLRQLIEPKDPHVSVRWFHARTPASELSNPAAAVPRA